MAFIVKLDERVILKQLMENITLHCRSERSNKIFAVKLERRKILKQLIIKQQQKNDRCSVLTRR